MKGLPTKQKVQVSKDLRVPMPDGVQLLADRYAPVGSQKGPVVLIRSPYGKSRYFASKMARPLAAQGFQVLMQCCRGTHGSSGVFNPHHDEKSDGLATIEWIKRQSWYDGTIATFGGSYLGYTQWALALAAGSEVKAMAMQVTLANFAQMTYAGRSLMLENALTWTNMVSHMESPRFVIRMLLSQIFGREMIRPEQWRLLPLETLDEKVVGKRVSFWRDWMRHDHADDPWWAPMDFERSISEVKRPISMTAGWFDIFLPWQLQNFAQLQKSGCPSRITVGPWRHADDELVAAGVTDAIDWFAQHMLPRTSQQPARAAVRLYIQGADQWRDFDSWPPRETHAEPLYLQPGRALTQSVSDDSPPDRYTYDANNPTPSIGGPALSRKPFSVDNRVLEERADVVTYTGARLPADVDVVGPIEAELYVSADVASVDVFVRLCDVDAAGRSMNVSDGLQRVTLPTKNAAQRVLVQLWPTAYRFKAGHQLRVQISSGAFPRWARNPGSDLSLGSAQTCAVAQVEIRHDRTYSSKLVLPVLD